MHCTRFRISAIGSCITDMRIGERYDLLGVGWVSQNFLITGHRRIKNNLSHSLPVSAN